MKKVLVYSHDTFGLGNIRRMLAISQGLLDHSSNLSILLVTGSPMIHSFRLSETGFDYLKLPCLNRNVEGQYGARSLGMETSDLVKLRSQMILAAAENFKPDVVVVDKKPFGVEHELKSTLDWLRSRGKGKAALLLRDILDCPTVTTRIWEKNNYFDAIERYYDRVLVVGSDKIFDVCKEYEFPNNIADKVKHCGYIKHQTKGTTASCSDHILPNDKKLILVTPGGGEDGFLLMDNYIRGLNEIKHCENFLSILVTGPEMPKFQRDIIQSAAKSYPNVLVKEFTNDLGSLIQQADLVVSMAGYNTVSEIVSMGKRAVVVPRTKPVKEQWIRAKRFEKRGLLTSIHPDTLTPSNLMQTIQTQLLNSDSPMLNPSEFKGRSGVAQEINDLLSVPDSNTLRDDPNMAVISSKLKEFSDISKALLKTRRSIRPVA